MIRMGILLAFGLCLASCTSSKPELAEQCALDSDCAAGLTCVGGRCRAECAEDRDCEDGEICVARRNAAASCVSLGDPKPCKQNEDCVGGGTCADGICHSRCDTERACAVGACDATSELCVEPDVVAGRPPNDTCEGALPIAVGDWAQAHTIAGANVASARSTVAGCDAELPDLFYSVMIPERSLLLAEARYDDGSFGQVSVRSAVDCSAAVSCSSGRPVCEGTGFLAELGGGPVVIVVEGRGRSLQLRLLRIPLNDSIAEVRSLPDASTFQDEFQAPFTGLDLNASACGEGDAVRNLAYAWVDCPYSEALEQSVDVCPDQSLRVSVQVLSAPGGGGTCGVNDAPLNVLATCNPTGSRCASIEHSVRGSGGQSVLHAMVVTGSGESFNDVGFTLCRGALAP